MFGTIEGIGIIVPIFGIILIGWSFYVENKTKQALNNEKSALIEKGFDPSLLDSKPKKLLNNLKAGLLLIAIAIGVVIGYILNLTLGIPSYITYPVMILLICG